MVTRRVSADYQQAGFGGLAFVTNNNFANLPMSYEQRLWCLESDYAFCLAKIEDDKKYKDNLEIADLSKNIDDHLQQAGRDYLPSFESHDTMTTKENDYRRLLVIIFREITQLQGMTKMIEHVKEEQVEAG